MWGPREGRDGFLKGVQCPGPAPWRSLAALLFLCSSNQVPSVPCATMNGFFWLPTQSSQPRPKKRAQFAVHSIGLLSQLCHWTSCVILSKLFCLSLRFLNLKKWLIPTLEVAMMRIICLCPFSLIEGLKAQSRAGNLEWNDFLLSLFSQYLSTAYLNLVNSNG